jgi:hypothetical protein
LPITRTTNIARVATQNDEARSLTVSPLKECEDYARECTMIAGLTNDKEVRDQMLKMAYHWMETATHERFALVVGPLAKRSRPGRMR